MQDGIQGEFYFSSLYLLFFSILTFLLSTTNGFQYAIFPGLGQSEKKTLQ